MGDVPLDALIETLPRPTLAIDAGERILALNAQARSLIGDGAQGRHFVTALRQPAVVEAVETCLVDHTPRTALYYAGDTQQQTTYEVHVQRMPAGGPVILSFQDVTHVAQAVQMRRDFVANVSHELRTPLTSMMGFIETLQGAARDDAAARTRFLDIMSGEAGRMNRLVGDLLSLSRVEAEERVRPTQRINLMAVLGTTLRNLTQMADEQNVTLNINYGTSVSYYPWIWRVPQNSQEKSPLMRHINKGFWGCHKTVMFLSQNLSNGTLNPGSRSPWGWSRQT